MSKGSTPRPVDRHRFAENYARIFGVCRRCGEPYDGVGLGFLTCDECSTDELLAAARVFRKPTIRQLDRIFKEAMGIKQTTIERILGIIVDELHVGPAQVTPEASFLGDLGADSLDCVEIVMGIEDEFKFDIPDEDAEGLETVGQLVRYVEGRLAREV